MLGYPVRRSDVTRLRTEATNSRGGASKGRATIGVGAGGRGSGRAKRLAGNLSGGHGVSKAVWAPARIGASRYTGDAGTGRPRCRGRHRPLVTPNRRLRCSIKLTATD